MVVSKGQSETGTDLVVDEAEDGEHNEHAWSHQGTAAVGDGGRWREMAGDVMVGDENTHSWHRVGWQAPNASTKHAGTFRHMGKRNSMPCVCWEEGRGWEGGGKKAREEGRS